MKYIMLNNEKPIIFPSDFSHDFMAKKFETEGKKVTSAGFYVQGKVTDQHSHTLQIGPGAEDEKLINKMLNEWAL